MRVRRSRRLDWLEPSLCRGGREGWSTRRTRDVRPRGGERIRWFPGRSMIVCLTYFSYSLRSMRGKRREALGSLKRSSTRSSARRLQSPILSHPPSTADTVASVHHTRIDMRLSSCLDETSGADDGALRRCSTRRLTLGPPSYPFSFSSTAAEPQPPPSSSLISNRRLDYESRRVKTLREQRELWTWK